MNASRIALRAYLAPLMSARAVRVGILLLILVLGVIGLCWALKPLSQVFPWIPEEAAENALTGLRYFLIMPGVPIAAILFSELPARDGIRQRTLLYPLLGPVSRGELLVVRTLATGVLLAAGVTVLVLFTRLLEGGSSPGGIPRELLGVLLSALAYTALFGFFHLLGSRGLFLGLTVFMVDWGWGQIPFSIRKLSISYHARVIMDRPDTLDLPIPITPPADSLIVSLCVLVFLAALFTWLSGVFFSRKNLGELC